MFQMEKRFRGVQRSVSRVIKSATSFRAVVGTLAGAAGLGLLVRRSLDTADNIAKIADAIGVTTDTLQELRFAADLAGVSQENLDSALLAFSKRVGEARHGTGTLITLLKNMDPVLLDNVQSVESMDQAFELIIQRASKMGNTLDHNALLAAAFGRNAGPAMANMLKQGSAGLEEMRRQARALGIVLDEEFLRNAESAKDQLTILATVLENRVIEAVIKNAEKIDTFARKLIEVLPGAVDTAVQALNILVDKLDVILASLAAIQGGVPPVWWTSRYLDERRMFAC